RSRPDLHDPDLYLFALPGEFRGYEVGYSANATRSKNKLTWAILKARTTNRAGTVELASASAFERPLINFHYFSDPDTRDMDALVQGVEFVRNIMKHVDGAKEDQPSARDR